MTNEPRKKIRKSFHPQLPHKCFGINVKSERLHNKNIKTPKKIIVDGNRKDK